MLSAHLTVFSIALLASPPLFAAAAPPKDKPVQARRADSDAPLAEGWPDATKPDTIEVKTYPAYRSAIAKAKGASLSSDNVLFFPLFNHISRKGVEMTAPVVSTYAPSMIENPTQTGDVSMEFVYRSTRQGETGQGVGAVKVEDHPPATYVCLGVQGEMPTKTLQEGVAKLHAWVAAHKTEWVEAGPPRRLGYHGPSTPAAERIWEVQLPIKPVDKASK